MMPDFSAKMHQIRLRTPLGELTALLRPPGRIYEKGRGRERLREREGD